MAGITIDKTLARGIYRDEIKNADGLVRPAGVNRSVENDFQYFAMDTFGKHLRKKGSLRPDAIRAISRALSSYKVGPSEHMFHHRSNVAPGSSLKSHVEVSFRNRPNLEGDEIASSSTYMFMNKDTFVTAKRPSTVLHSGHAVRRYLERGTKIDLSDQNVAKVIRDTYAMTGLFVFLSWFTNRVSQDQISVPFRDGLFLCSLKPGFGEQSGSVARPGCLMMKFNAPLWDMVHPALLRKNDQMVIGVNTFIGPNELKPGQVGYYNHINDMVHEFAHELALLGELDGIFHPGQNLALVHDLAKAAPRLDEAAKDFAEALKWDKEFLFGFNRGRFFNPVGLTLPSTYIAKGISVLEDHRALAIATGREHLGGGLFCHLDDEQKFAARFIPETEGVNLRDMFPPKKGGLHDDTQLSTSGLSL